MKSNHCRKLGSEGQCVCPKCDFVSEHTKSVPCQQEHCPNCGAKLLREGSYHHDLWVKKSTPA